MVVLSPVDTTDRMRNLRPPCISFTASPMGEFILDLTLSDDVIKIRHHVRRNSRSDSLSSSRHYNVHNDHPFLRHTSHTVVVHSLSVSSGILRPRFGTVSFVY